MTFLYWIVREFHCMKYYKILSVLKTSSDMLKKNSNINMVTQIKNTEIPRPSQDHKSPFYLDGTWLFPVNDSSTVAIRFCQFIWKRKYKNRNS